MQNKSPFSHKAVNYLTLQNAVPSFQYSFQLTLEEHKEISTTIVSSKAIQMLKS